MAKDAAAAAAVREEADSMSINPSEDNCIVEVEEREPLCGELWKACAGQHLCIPKEGEKVVYFPQGHIEQVEPYGNQGGSNMLIPTCRVPFKIPCLVVNAQFLVEAETDEVYVGYTLIPSNEEANNAVAARNSMSTSQQQDEVCIYSKTLTAADISTHGGFALAQRFADECLTPMDMSRDPPAQIVVMKDLNGKKWPFLHIYHSELNQHMLTTGWDKFVTDKKLVEGDKIIYLRDAVGEIRIGVHRATSAHRSKYTTSESFQGVQRAILICVAHALTSGSLFTVFYRPWASDSCFLVPFDKYMMAMEEEYSIRARFKMLVGNEECTGPRYALGRVVERSPVDPIRWSGSEWRRLKVNWDAPSVMCPLPERVSPWEIELLSPRKSNRERRFRCLRFNCMASLVLGILGLIIIAIYVQVGATAGGDDSLD